MRSILAVFVFAVALAPFTAQAAEGEYIDRFGGNWSGTGTLIKGAIPFQVNCRAAGAPETNRITIEGDCSLAIASVRIAADITFDPKTGRYSGTYIGAKVGPARVSGMRDGDVVRLVITWPKPVQGDTRASMIIENAGEGRLRIVINDNVLLGGPEQRTSDMSLAHI
jgi:hypothetical protein